MKRLYLIFAVLLLSYNMFSQDTDTNEYNITYYPNGKVLSEGMLKNGKPEGYWKTYYTTGIIKSEGNRKNHLLDSTWVFYNSVGDTISKINYLMGKKNGYYYEYLTDRKQPENVGNILSKELYINDIKEGKSYYYYNNGNLKEEVNYRKNKKEGQSIEYAEDGIIITINRYSKGDIVERQKINRYNDEGKKAGEWREFYDNFKVKNEANYKNGLLDGYYKEYNPSGKLILTLLYSEGRLVQQVEEENTEMIIKEIKNNEGIVVESGPYINETRVGIHNRYDNDGNITETRIYSDNGELLSVGLIDIEGNKKGIWKNYYLDGSIKETGEYVNNLKEGRWTYYFNNGQIEQIGEFVKGKENGTWKWYSEKGELLKEEEFYNGKEEGLYTEYDESGNVIVVGEYFDGEKEGEWTLIINDFSAKGSYVTGLRDGKWRYYYDDGSVMFEGNYIQGNPDGKHKYYHPNGELKEEQFFSGGIPNKHWKKFDEEGNIIVTITYEDGKEYRINGVKIDFPESNKILIQ
ncbi:MAG: hypothetical protein JW894_09300 [Bacteroidales bacterium]|nr:hypothetical protein [Bacteroidales bacterium]